MVETSANAAYQKGQLYQLPLSEIRPDSNQPRKIMEPQALEELAASIKRHGVLQPILFRTGDGGVTQVSEAQVTPEVADAAAAGMATTEIPIFYVVAGERRVAAAKQAGLTTIPGIYVEGNHAEIALVENLLRQDLTAVEEAEALQRLLEEQKYTQEQLAGIIGKARTTVGDILTLNKLPQAIRDECRGDRQITRSTLIEIARKKQERSMTTAYNAYKVKQQKGKGKATRQKTVETPEVILQWVSKANTKLKTINSKLLTQITRQPLPASRPKSTAI